jgi:hypothetical protein
MSGKRPAPPVTLATIKDRCNEVGECWMWAQGLTSRGTPNMRVGREVWHVRRFAFMLAGGVLLPRQPIDCTCGERLCVKPEHAFATDQKALSRKASQRGAFANRARDAKVAAWHREPGRSKLSMEMVREIRASTESSLALAARYGVSRSRVTRVRNHDAWKDYTNPYMSLAMTMPGAPTRRARHGNGARA